ncbi:MAG: hypothetical protein LH609_15150 [Rudanella sp.]|nr:hypothetical protein [Rudanella sp.]
MRRICVLLVVVWGGLIAHQSRAQFPVTDSFDRPAERVDTLRVRGMKHAPRWVVKVNPLSLLDLESTYRLDVERMLGGVYSVQGGLGYGTGYTQIFSSGSTLSRGRETWRAQLEGRRYLRRNRAANRWQPNRLFIHKPLDTYFAAEVFYKQVNAPIEGTLQRGCDLLTCQFFERYSARAARYVTGFHLKLGQQMAIRLSETNNRLLIDCYVGAGLRWRRFEQYGVPNREDARSAPDFFINQDPTSNWGLQRGRSLSIAAGVQVGYVF